MITFMAVRHKTRVQIAWISCGKLFANVRERRFNSVEFQNDSVFLPDPWTRLFQLEESVI